MGFAGNLQTLSLGEVLQSLNRSQASGMLAVTSPSSSRDIVFARGEIIGVCERSGEDVRALLMRLVQLGRLESSVLELGDPSAQIREAIERGAIDAADTADISRQLALEQLYELGTWRFAEFEFHEEATATPEIAQLMATFRESPIDIRLSSVLIESARRSDEWNLLKESFAMRDVLELRPGPPGELERFGEESPGCAVIPLIDGARSIEDVLRDGMVPRYETYQLLGTLLDRGLIVVLNAENLVQSGDQADAAGDTQRAAKLYRGAIAADPEDDGAAAKLAACIERLGDAPEAADMHGQLALRWLERGQGEQAIAAARRAANLVSDRPEVRMTLVRCLISQGREQEAVDELKDAAQRFAQLGRDEEARDACRKVSQLQPDDEDSQRLLARLFAKTGKVADAPNGVVCIQCGADNKRNAVACVSCSAKLQLSCLNCERNISVSDQMCVFCGADPHLRREARRPNGLGSTLETGRIIITDKIRKDIKERGSTYWRVEMQKHLDTARSLETANRLEDALAAWKQLQLLQSDNGELVMHIRKLEELCHERFVEGEIARGNLHRRRRSYWRALRSYGLALRGVGEQDPRRARLDQLIVQTRKAGRQIAIIYGGAAVLLLLAGVLAGKPYVDLRRYASDAGELGAAVSTVSTPADYAVAAERAVSFAARSDGFRGSLRNEARRLADEVADAIATARERVVAAAVKDAEEALAREDTEGVRRFSRDLRLAVTEGEHLRRLDGIEERSAQMERRRLDAQRRRSEAPALLAKAREHERAGALGLALRLYDESAASGDTVTAEEAKAAAGKLRPLAQRFAGELRDIDALGTRDLNGAKRRLVALADDVKRWDAEAEVERRRELFDRRLAAAAAAWKPLVDSGDPVVLERFLADHGAAPEAALVQARLTQVRTAARSRDATLAQYREASKAKEWERAWQLGSTLVRNHPDLLQGGQVTLPLVIESLPSGAAVSLDGKAIGTTPMVHAQIPGVVGELRMTLPGYRPSVRSTSEAANDWRWRVDLLREPVWTLELGHGVGLLHPIPGGFFVHSADTVQMVGRDGRPGWKFRATAGDDLIEGSRVRLAHPPIELGDGRIAFGLSDHNLVILDAAGALVREIRTESAVRGRPQSYANDILGGGRRLAFGAEKLQVGPLDGTLTAIDVGSPVLSGPLAYANDLDRLMVTATLDGKLVGSEESTQKRLWSIDLVATDVAQLVPLGRDALLCVLDGSRIACYQAGPTGAAERWRAKLDEPAIGNPVIAADGSILLAAGSRILRFRPDGTPLSPLQLASSVTGSIALDGDILVVGSKGHLSVFRAGKLAWSTVLPAPVTAVAVTPGLVVAGLADGKLLAFSP